MIDPVKTGDLISKLRKERDITQLALSAQLRVTHQAVSKWETGGALPDPEMLLALAKLFKVSIESLLNGEVKRTNTDDINDEIPADKIAYSEVMADVVKTTGNLSTLTEAYPEMLGKDIADCIQTLNLREEKLFVLLSGAMSSAELAQVIKTFKSAPLLMAVKDKMTQNDLLDCVKTIPVTDSEQLKLLLS